MQTIKEPKYRASKGPSSRNHWIYWLIAGILAVGLVWIWWGQQKKPKSARKQPEKVAPAAKATPKVAMSNPPVVVPSPKVATLPPITNEVVRVTPLPKIAPPQEIVRSNIPAKPAPVPPAKPSPVPWTRILDLQMALVRAGISPGPLDGIMGSQTRAALRTFQEIAGLSATGSLDAETELRLLGTSQSLGSYVVTEEDMGRLLPLSNTWLGKSQQERLDYETILELVAEKFHAHPALIKKLNPNLVWAEVGAGTTVAVPMVDYPVPGAKAAYLKIFVGNRLLQACDGEDRLLAQFPCSIAQRVEKRPIGEELHVAVLAPKPNYTFDPAVFPESAEAQRLGRKLILQPGPNNPVGTVWIGLDKPGYGIHGTPNPEAVGRTESHGCFRLANWNAEYLLKLVSLGTPVFVEP